MFDQPTTHRHTEREREKYEHVYTKKERKEKKEKKRKEKKRKEKKRKEKKRKRKEKKRKEKNIEFKTKYGGEISKPRTQISKKT